MMSDTALVTIVLTVGGVLYAATFLWITAVRVREIESQRQGHAPATNPAPATGDLPEYYAALAFVALNSLLALIIIGLTIFHRG